MNAIFEKFLTTVKPTQLLWALKDPTSDNWVILDSLNYEDSEVMPLWSTKSNADVHRTDGWEDYECASITIADWLEFWVEDLINDNVIIGIDWLGKETDLEMDLQDFTHGIATLESI